MDKHTPGPWESISCRVFQVDSVGGRQIVTGCRGGTDEEMRANALLIAAAPELLDAVRVLSEFLTREGLLTGNIDAIRPVLDAARAAIANATGGGQ